MKYIGGYGSRMWHNWNITRSLSLGKSISQKLQRKLKPLQAILDLNQFYQWLQLTLEMAQENFSGIHCENNYQ